jgi:murein L,D-transpeptidase YcbB/YkuD
VTFPRFFLVLALLATAACDRAPEPVQQPAAATPTTPVAVAKDIAAFYKARGNRPLWVTNRGPRPEATTVGAMLAKAGDHGLDPERYRAPEVAAAIEAARGGDPKALARAELLLSNGYAAYLRDLRVPQRDRTIYGEAGLAPKPTPPSAALEAAAAAPSLAAHLTEATAMNPLYESLSRGYAKWRAAPHSKAQDALVRANLDRARAIPASAGRYIVVDTASARLWTIEGRRVEGPMRVIVGKPDMQTPLLASRIRYVMLNPFWNMPPDLARERAKRVLREGPGFLAREHMQILSDWSDAARPIPASAVNWRAVAAGRETLRLRQLPGGANVMGAVKFMMANDLGIYLHDFPNKALFALDDRRRSSGCVRLSDAPALARWLFRGAPPSPAGGRAEQRVDLPEAVPVYLTYLTVLPGGPGGLTFQPDGYGRERGRQTLARPVLAD